MSTTYLATARVVTSYEPVPHPCRQYDWTATRDGYEPGEPIGHGETEAQAVAELVEQEEARDERCECGACEGSGRIPHGGFGAYYRDGTEYDAPGVAVCEACNGEGRAS